MFKTLPESRPLRSRRVGGTVFSMVAHGALIAGAVSLTMARDGGARIPDEHVPLRPPVFVPVSPKTPAAPRTPAPQTGQPRAQTGAPPTIVIDNVIPPGIPPIDIDAPRLPEGDVIIARGGTRGVPTDGIARGRELGGSGVVIGEREVDRAPRTVGTVPTPHYPETLRGAGITGRVMAQFVVDTLGRAEMTTVEILDATRPEFADAVRAALPRFRFTPGEFAGLKVRTRVQIPFDFALR